MDTESKLLRTIIQNLPNLSDVESKRVSEHASVQRLASPLKETREIQRAMVVTGSKLLRTIILNLPNLSATDLKQLEEHASGLGTTRLAEEAHHAQTQGATMRNNLKLLPSTAPSLATAATVSEATAAQNPTFTMLNEELKSHLATQELFADWSGIMEYYMEQATKIRLVVPFRFLDLPEEIRHIIYEMIVTPEMAADHLKKNKIPALFKVSRQMTESFASFYYGPKVFRVELFDSLTSSWEELKNPDSVRAMFEEWPLCHVGDDVASIAECKRVIEFSHEDDEDEERTNRWGKKGTLTWVGGPGLKGVRCYFREGSAREKRESRSKRLSKDHSRREKWRRFLEDS